jgi:hypothetical protein
MGVATAIPWITFTGFNQKTSNGIYPALLFYHERKILIVAYGIWNGALSSIAICCDIPKQKGNSIMTLRRWRLAIHVSWYCPVAVVLTRKQDGLQEGGKLTIAYIPEKQEPELMYKLFSCVCCTIEEIIKSLG